MSELIKGALMKRYFFWLFSTVFLCSTTGVYAWDDSRLATPIVINHLTIPYPQFSIFVLPEQAIDIRLKTEKNNLHNELDLIFNGQQLAPGAQTIKAPLNPGLYALQVKNKSENEQALIGVFVMTPSIHVDAKGVLNGYRIGHYPSSLLRNNPIYSPPTGFIELTEQNRQTQVSPNFKLGDFASKQDQPYPKYLVLKEALLLKLENILAALNNEGITTDTLTVMSGYRTPWYNKAIGNVQYSRYQWGGACDFFVDHQPKDGIMDDLNGDGVINRADAEWLAMFIDTMSRKGRFGKRIGGLGIYDANSAHGPFVHVDVRGERARW